MMRFLPRQTPIPCPKYPTVLYPKCTLQRGPTTQLFPPCYANLIRVRLPFIGQVATPNNDLRCEFRRVLHFQQ